MRTRLLLAALLAALAFGYLLLANLAPLGLAAFMAVFVGLAIYALAFAMDLAGPGLSKQIDAKPARKALFTRLSLGVIAGTLVAILAAEIGGMDRTWAVALGFAAFGLVALTARQRR